MIPALVIVSELTFAVPVLAVAVLGFVAGYVWRGRIDSMH